MLKSLKEKFNETLNIKDLRTKQENLIGHILLRILQVDQVFLLLHVPHSYRGKENTGRQCRSEEPLGRLNATSGAMIKIQLKLM